MDYEVILVDDGSADQTSHIIDAMADADPRVMVVHHPTNLGYGAALQSGIRAATKTLVFYPDGDGQFDLNELPPLLPLMKQYDIVSCFRLNRQDGLFRRFNDWCWTNFLSASNCATVWTAVALAQLSRRRIKVFQEAGLVASKRPAKVDDRSAPSILDPPERNLIAHADGIQRWTVFSVWTNSCCRCNINLSCSRQTILPCSRP